MAERESAGRPALAEQFLARAQEYEEDAELVRRMIAGGIGHFDEAEPEAQSGGD